MSNYCSECAAPLKPQAKSCGTCGTRIAILSPAENSVRQSATTRSAASQTVNQRWSWPAFLLNGVWLIGHGRRAWGTAWLAGWVACSYFTPISRLVYYPYTVLFNVCRVSRDPMPIGVVDNLFRNFWFITFIGLMCTYIFLLIMSIPIALTAGRIVRAETPDGGESLATERRWTRSLIWAVPSLLFARFLINGAIYFARGLYV